MANQIKLTKIKIYMACGEQIKSPSVRVPTLFSAW
jgi:hypothetical protein